MLIDERRQQVKHILQEIKDLAPDARQRVMALDLPVFESLVMAELCRAHQLLAQDHSFDWKQREDAWHAWRDHMLRAIENSLRYHPNDPLILAIGVCATLFPMVHRGAGLMGYKTLDDIVLISQRTGNMNKKERHEMRLRIKDVVMRISVQSDFAETAGIALHYHDPQAVMRLVECVMPVRWQPQAEKTIILPEQNGV